jgi:hypothetical protein
MRSVVLTAFLLFTTPALAQEQPKVASAQDVDGQDEKPEKPIRPGVYKSDLGGRGPGVRQFFLWMAGVTALNGTIGAGGYFSERNVALNEANVLRSMGGVAACLHPNNNVFGWCDSHSRTIASRDFFGNWMLGMFTATAAQLSFVFITYAIAPRGARLSASWRLW